MWAQALAGSAAKPRGIVHIVDQSSKPQNILVFRIGLRQSLAEARSPTLQSAKG